MVQKIRCECAQRYEAKINSWAFYQEIKEFFEKQVALGAYQDVPVEKPFYTWRSRDETIDSYADKWYRCKNCGCLWEFVYPDFPGVGFVRKFPDGVYRERGY